MSHNDAQLLLGRLHVAYSYGRFELNGHPYAYKLYASNVDMNAVVNFIKGYLSGFEHAIKASLPPEENTASFSGRYTVG